MPLLEKKIFKQKNGFRKKPTKGYAGFMETAFWKKVFDEEAGFVADYLRGCRNILDIGCGAGFLEKRMGKFSISGIDSSRKMIENARRQSNKKFYLGKAEKLPFSAKRFDGAVFITTLEFLDDFNAAVKEAARILERKGKFIALILNPESNYFKQKMRKKLSYVHNIKHTDLNAMKKAAEKYFSVKTGYFLGIEGKKVFDSRNRWDAALFAIKGIKK